MTYTLLCNLFFRASILYMTHDKHDKPYFALAASRLRGLDVTAANHHKRSNP